MSRWKRLASERFVATTLVLFASSIGGIAGCEVIAKVDRSQIDENGGGGNGGMGGMGGSGGATCTPVDDMNDCTTDECVDGKPVNTPLTAGTMCGADKDMFCDDNAMCVACLMPSDCPGVDDECQTRTCTMGTCGFDYTAKDTALAVQTAGDCKLKVCDGMGAQIDNNDDTDVPDDNNACTDDACTAGTPSNPPLAAGTQCGMDGMGHPLVCNDLIQCVGCNAATDCPGTDDECKQRTCVANVCGVSYTPDKTPVMAQTDNDCLVQVCDGDGNIVASPDDNDLPLDDGNACTGETCSMGAANHPPVANGSACSDNDGCTLMDTCQMGVCTAGMPVTCTASDQCHVAGTCDSMTGMCSNPPAADGTNCNDGDLCTQTDTCQTGSCTGSNPVVCAASDQCHVAGTCDTMTGMCSNPPAMDGTGCNDDNACTQSDSCVAGSCTGANPVTCSASDACHVAGTCDTMTGMCSNPAAMDGTMCTSNMVSGACTMGACVACGDGIVNGTETCDDGNATAGDGCNATCAVETGYACMGAPSVCAPICGDGLLRPGEQCDDKNTTSGDGCSSACQLDIGCAMGEIPVIVTNTTATPIPDTYNGVLSSVSVGQAGVVRRVIPTLYVTHGNVDHLDIFLQSPYGQQRVLMQDMGTAANLLATTFSDSATAGIGMGVAPYTGSFIPLDTLSDAAGFATQSAAGNWLLRVSDDAPGTTGTLNAWALALCIDPSVPSVCGNGYVEANEQCDDGNTASSDGCSSACQLEITCGSGQTLVVQRSAQTALLIPDNNLTGVLSPITIAAPGVVAKAVVVVNAVAHAYDADVDLSLVSPGNTTLDLSSDNGGTGDHYMSTVFDDAAATAVTAGAVPFRGRFRPEAALSGVSAQTAAGTWNLKLVDDAASDVGVLTSWSLGLCVAPPPVCGNGTVEPNEVCDDNNTTANDGCSATCTIEQGWGCTGMAPSVCTFTCGNGTVTGNEQCDDGNTNNNDGCNSVCLYELTPETEANESCPAANGPYLPPFIMDGAITPINDQDYVAITVPAYADLKIQTFAPTIGVCASGNDTVIELRAADCTTVLASNDQGGIPSCSLIDSATSAGARHVAPGTYYISTHDYLNDGTIASYKLQVRFNALCGNGLIEGSEQCDGGAGCNADCTLVPVCGNGIVQSGEQCDDGNTTSGDSCNVTCQWETNAEVEPNGTTAEADTNATNVPQLLLDGTRNITAGLAAADKDIFKVSVTAADTVVSFETFDSSGRDCVGMTSTRLTLLDNAGAQLKQDTLTAGISTCSELAVLLQPGTYYIQVDNSSGSAVTNYFLRTVFHTSNGNEVEPNNTQPTATANPGFTSQIFGDHQVSTDDDWYSVTIPTTGASLRIETIEGDASETCESNGIDSTITLFNAAGAQLASDGDTGRGWCSQIDGTGATPAFPGASNLSAGTYYIHVKSFSTTATAGNQFNYRLVTVVR